MNSTKPEILDQNEVRSIGRELLESNKSIQFRLGGHSMWPTLVPGDVGIIEPTEISSLKLGQIAVFEGKKGWVAHRVVRIEKRDLQILIRTQGDSIRVMDDAISSEQLVGVISVVHRKDKAKNLKLCLFRYVYLRPFSQLLNRLLLTVRRPFKKTFRFG